MRDFGAIVRVSPRVMGDQRHEVPMGDTVAAQLVGHEPHGFLSLTLQQSAKESPRCTPVPTGLYEDVDQVTVLIHRAPEILALTVDRHEDFVQEPRISESTLSSLQLPSVVGAELPAPLASGFVGHDDASFGQQILNIPEAQAVSVVEPDGMADDVGRKAMPMVAGPESVHPENPPRQGFFEHPEYLAVRAHLPAPWQDILDVAYYSGWRKNEILGLTWEEIDEAGGVIRLSPARSKTLVGRILPISQPIAEALARRRARRDPDNPLVFHRDGIPVRRWRTAWRTACQAAGVPTRFLHDCRRTAARNLIRANVPERVAMLLTGHKSRAIFDRYNIIHEQELLDAGDQLVEYLAQQAQAVPARRRPHPASTAAPRTAPALRLVRRGTA